MRIKPVLLSIFILSFCLEVQAYEVIDTNKYLEANSSRERKEIIDFITQQFKPFYTNKISQRKLEEIWNNVDLRDELFLSRFQIIGQKLYADSHNITGDQFNMLFSYLKTLVKTYKIKDVDFIVYTRDEIPEDSKFKEESLTFPGFMFSKDTSYEYEKDKLLIPDPFMLQPKWQDLINEINEANLKYPWDIKQDIIFWRGYPSGARHKEGTELQLFGKLPRISLVMLSALYPDLIDAKFFIPEKDPIRKNSPEFIQIIEDIFGKEMKFIKASDHLKYKYLISIDGSTCSWRRVPWIMLSNSALFKQETPKIEWFYPSLKPYKHYVPLKEDISDIFTVLSWSKKNDDKLKVISENASNFIRNALMPKDIDAQFVITLNEYSKIQSDEKIYPTLTPADKLMHIENLFKLLFHKLYRKITNYFSI